MVRLIGLLTTVFCMTDFAHAVVTPTFFNERVALQGYITASGGSIPNGTYKMQITLKKSAGVTFWQKEFAAAQITNGVFSVTLSGNDDLGPTALTADLFDLASGAQSLQMDVIVDINLNTVLEAGETFSAIPIVAVPTAMLANRCNTAINVVDDAIGTSKIEDGAVTMSKIDQASAASGEVLTWSGSAWVPTAIPTPSTFSGSIAGDVSGTVGATSVDKIKGGTLTITGLAANEILVYDGSAWVNKKIDSASLFSGTIDLSSNLTGTTYAIDVTGNAATATTATTAGSFSGSLTGDVTGTQGATVVDAIKGTPVSAAASSAGQILIYDGSAGYAPLVLSGDATMASTGVVTLTNTGTAGTYVGVTTDAQGRVTAGTSVAGTGTCSFTQAVTNAWANATCTGVPASVSVVVACSPAAALSAATGVVFRATGTLNQIALRGTAAATSATWNCFWVRP